MFHTSEQLMFVNSEVRVPPRSHERVRVCRSRQSSARSAAILFGRLRAAGQKKRFLRVSAPVSQFLISAKKLAQNPVLSF
jgi:hypothetical protein